MTAPDKYALARRLAALEPAQKARLLPSLAGQGVDFSRLPIVAAADREHWPLSFQQQRLWFVSRMGGSETALHISGLLRLDGELDEQRLQASLDRLVERHAALRTRFGEDRHGLAWQAIDADARVTLARSDLRDLPAEQREAAAMELARSEANRPFDLARAPLLRLRLIDLGEGCQWLALTQHHLISDGWSGEILLRELCALYAATTPLPEPGVRYVDYAQWQRDLATTGVFESQLSYWREQLAAPDQASLTLPTDHLRSADRSFAGARLRVRLSAAVSERLRHLARSRDTSLFNVLLTVLHCALARLGGNPDVRVGVPSANRARDEVAGVVGFFVNTLVIRASAAPRDDFDELLQRLQQAMLEAHAHQDVPFEQIAEALQPQRSLAANPLFQVKFTQQLALLRQPMAPGLYVTPMALDDGAARFDLGLDVTDRADGIEGVLTYATALFEPSSVQRLADTVASFAEQIAEAPAGALADLQLPGARAAALGARRQWPEHDVLALWRRQVSADGAALALFSEAGGAISRDRLDQASERIAAHLRACGVGVDSRVALCAPRSPAFVMGLLGILKAGAAYVPLDPATPPARLRQLREDSAARLALGHAEGSTALHEAGWPALTLTGDCTQPLAAQPASDPLPDVALRTHALLSSDQAAYLIYTSGSTGQPKAVVVSHAALADYAQGIIEQLGWGPALRMAMVSTVAADLGHTVLFAALGSGAALYLPSAECAFDATQLGEFMQRHRIDVLKMVPSHLAALLQGERPAAVLPRHSLVLGGEALPRGLARQIAQLQAQHPSLAECRVFNHYGPTETTVGVLAAQVTPGNGDVALGRPLPNAIVHLLDEQLRPVPVGVDGELYIGGPGVARGYQGRPGLTAERFVPDPHGQGERLYRSGDRGRWTQAGELLFLGRIDEQVKIRGYRVEPREIAELLREHPQVTQAVAIASARDDGTLQLLAYAVMQAAGDVRTLRGWLAERLPDYMLPAQVWELERLPLTANGKLDRNALPTQDLVVAAAADEPPQGALEQLLADIWQQVLGREAIGRHANFFDLGGDSILSLQIIGRARRAGYKLTPRQVFEHSSIAALAKVATAVKAKARPSAATAPGAATPAQARFLALALPRPQHWNQSVRLRCRRPLPAEHLHAALQTLVQRHTSLHLRPTTDGQLEVVEPAPQVSLQVLQVLHATEESAFIAACEQAQRSLDLPGGRLLHALYAPQLSDGAQLLVVIHHLAVDGVSWRVLAEELELLCTQLAAGSLISLPPPGLDARTWAGLWRQRLAAGALQDCREYWLEQARAVTPWPLDGLAAGIPGAGTTNAGTRVAQYTVSLGAAASQALLALPGSQRRLHIDDLLLSAYATALASVAGRRQARVWVDVEGHGRDELPGDEHDLSRSVGWFTSTYPLQLLAEHDPRATLAANRQQRLATPQGGVSYGLLRELADAEIGAALRAGQLPNLRFNYLGVLDAGFAEQALLTLAHGPRGSERDPHAAPGHALALDAHVQGGQLQLCWSYDRECMSETAVAGLARAFGAALARLVALAAEADFATLAPADFPMCGLDAQGLCGLDLAAARVEDLYPLSPMQRGILFEVQWAPEQGRYLNQFALTLHAPDVERFHAAWAATVARHAVLRSGIVEAADGEPALQWVDRLARMPVEQFDLSASSDPHAALQQLAEAQRLSPFELARPPLMRAALVRLPGNDYRFLWTRHHLLLDGWSSARVLAEVLQRYRQSDLSALASTPARYRDYLAWLLAQPGVDAADGDSPAAAFWRPRVNALVAPTLLAAALPAPRLKATGTSGHGFVDACWSPAQTAQLEQFARSHRLTLNTLLQGAWLLVLQRCSGHSSVAFGATVAGRPADLPGVEQMIGLFINTLPIVREVDPSAAPLAWLQALQAENLALREYEHMPLAAIQRLRQGAAALFDSLLVFENYPLDAQLGDVEDAERALRYSAVATVETTGYPLALVATCQAHLQVRLIHDLSAFDGGTVQRLASQLQAVLAQLTAPATRTLGQISLLDSTEQDRFAQRSQGPQWPLPLDFAHDSVAARVLGQARRNPHATALQCAGQSLDYAQLLQRSQRLAALLQARGIGPGQRVAIALGRGLDLPVAMLAVWQVGAAYVPLDPEYPAERLAYVLEDAGISAAIADAEGRARLPRLAGVDVLWPEHIDACAPLQTAARLQAAQAAYVIYTSGSTGRPKGVVVGHGALANFIEAMRRTPGMVAGERLLAVTSLSFDIAVLEMMLPLVVGGTVHIARQLEARDPQFLRTALSAANVMQATPATWRLLLDDGWQPARGMRLFCGGEALPADLARALLKPGVQLWNLYGPTEATVWTSAAAIDQVAAVHQSIGRPIGNTTLYILDPALQPLPVGVAGELYIGGHGLAQGYHGRPGLSAERFVADPFAGPGARMYRSGDLARWREDGAVEYLGRIDQQVKVRGFRIELGEIEAVLEEHPHVRQAAVVARAGAAGQRLLAYACAAPGLVLDHGQLRSLLGSRLPAYMQPAQIVQLEQMPLTPNGKLDRAGLPEPAMADAPAGPRSAFETRMAALWEPLLGVGAVAAEDDFFALGGHSLLATRLVTQVCREFAVQASLRGLFEAPTLRGFSAYVEQLGGAAGELDAMGALLDEFALE